MTRPLRAGSRLTRRQAGLIVALLFAVASTVVGPLTSSSNPLGEGLSGFAVSFFGSVVYTAVGLIILWRRPGHGIGRLALAVGLAFSASGFLRALLAILDVHGSVQPVFLGLPAKAIDLAIALSEALPAIGLVVGGILLIVWFPDGRRSSRLGLVAELGLAAGIGGSVIATVRDPILQTIGWSQLADAALNGAIAVGIGGLLLAYLVGVIDLARRYRRADGIRRVQMRWVLAAVVLGVVLLVSVLLWGETIFGLWDVWIASTMLPVLAVAVAITRYRLYDIDRIVSNTVGYSLVTVVLVAIFWIVNLGLQQAMRPLTGNTPIAVASSTLLVAALFNPVRSRIQAVVDHRFHRARYDAERLVESFSTRLRHELDLDHLAHDLTRTTSAAVEPTTASIWLRVPGSDR